MYKAKDKLKDARVANGFSQQQMADLLHIERATYAAYEKGKTEPSYSIGIKISQILKVDDTWLLFDEPVNYVLRSESVYDQMYIKDRGATMGYLDRDEREFVAFYRMMKLMGKSEELKEFIQKELSEGENEE